MSMQTISNQFFLFINGDGFFFNIVYHNLNNFNVFARFAGHNGEELCHGITIFTNLLNNIIIVSHKLQDNIISKSIVTKKFQNLFQINSFSHNIMFC